MSKVGSSEAGMHRRTPAFNGVEAILVSSFIQNTDFNLDLVGECVDRGFLPLDFGDWFSLAKFLGRTILAAQRAQRSYGVPASFLIGIALYESGWNADRLADDDAFDSVMEPESCCSLGIQKWFLKTAQLLAESAEYASAMPFIGNLKTYAEKLCALGFRDSLFMEDVLGPIEIYKLEECDLAPLRQPNEYRRNLFTECRDDSGSRSLRLSCLDFLSPVDNEPVPLVDVDMDLASVKE